MPPSSPTSAVSTRLSAADARRIARHAAAADDARWLHPVQQALLHRRGWLKMLAPRELGGFELPLPEVVRLEEAVARVDGSTAWTLTLCAGAGWFAGFLPPRPARAILATKRVCLAGSGAPTGYADIDGDGYRLDGCWDYASGAPMATHFTCNAVLRREGAVLLDTAGRPMIKAFVLPAALVEIVPSWRSIGLRATASHAYRVRGGRVDAAHAFDIDPARATAGGPLYRFPFMAFAYITLTANLAGIGQHFVDLAGAAVAQRRNRFADDGGRLVDAPPVAAALASARARLDAARARALAALDAAWLAARDEGRVDGAQAAALETLSLDWAAAARAAVDTLFPLCGLAAMREDSEINRVWRDFHTASQHALLTPLVHA